MVLSYCHFCFPLVSCEQLDGIQSSFAYALMLTRSRLELLDISFYRPQTVFVGAYIVFMSIHYILVSVQGISNKLCLFIFLVFDWIIIKLADNRDRHKISDKLILAQFPLLARE